MCGINGIFAYGDQMPFAEAIGDDEIGCFVGSPTVDNIKNALQCFFDGPINFKSLDCKHFTWRKVDKKALPFYLPVSGT